MNYQVMPELTPEEYEELKADISQRGVMIPIEYDELGNVLDGYHRLQICEELGIKDYPKVIRAGLTEAEKFTHARKLNIARRHLTNEQKRTLIREQLKATPEQSDRQIAKTLGVSNPTVSAQRKQMEAEGELLNFNSCIGADGKERPRLVNHTTTTEQGTDEETLDEDDETVSPEPEQTSTQKPHVSYNSGNNEWYTSPEYIELARSVMGSIDIDPASSEIANKVVKAKKYYTQETDGLSQEWSGNVWLNPPYSSELITKFVEKFIAELPGISQAPILVNNATETEWFNKLVKRASAVCFPQSRVKFYAPDGNIGAPLQGQAILYFGERIKEFLDKFGVKGWCAIPR